MRRLRQAGLAVAASPVLASQKAPGRIASIVMNPAGESADDQEAQEDESQGQITEKTQTQ